MGKASRRKRERHERSILIDEEIDYAITAGMVNLLRASSVIADEDARKAREENMEASFIRQFSCECRPPCAVTIQVPSMFNPERLLKFTPCRRSRQ